jgi:peptide/nickel transport system permease protein
MTDLAAHDTRSRWREFCRSSSVSFRVGIVILALHLLAAALGPFLSPYGATEIGTGVPLSGISLAHPMGVDQIGRDVFSRVLNGAHIVILLSVAGPRSALCLAPSSASCRRT